MRIGLVLSLFLLGAGIAHASQQHVVNMEDKKTIVKWSEDGDIHIFNFNFGKLRISDKSKLFKVDCAHNGIWIRRFSGKLPEGISARYYYISGDRTFMDITFRPTLPEKLDAGSVEKIVSDANAVFDAGNFETAQKLYMAVYTKYPQDRLAPFAMFMAGHCLNAQLKFTEAISVYNAVVNKYSDSSSARLAFYRIACLKAGFLDDEDAGVKLFEAYIQKFPGDDLADDCLFNIAALKEIDGKNAEAAKIYSAIIAKFPSGSRAKFAAENLKELK